MKTATTARQLDRSLAHLRLRAFRWLAVAPLVACGVVEADEGARVRRRASDEMTSGLRLAAARGLDHLVRLQERQGGGDFDGEVPVAVNALAGLALLSAGVTEDSGPASYTTALRRCTDALLRRQTKGGYFNDNRSGMYGHGFGTLYFAELYGTTPRRHKRLREALRRALNVIEASQGREGGWDYLPHKDFGGRKAIHSDTSITVCQTMALRAAKNLGLSVDSTVVQRAKSYIERAQNDDGGFRYRKTELDEYIKPSSTFPRSAAGVCILYSLGEYNSDSIRRGFDYLQRKYRTLTTSYPFYAHYYCSQAMFQAGGSRWREYFPYVRDQLIRTQRDDGGWRSGQHENDAQATAMALIVLHLPLRYLPIHER